MKKLKIEGNNTFINQHEGVFLGIIKLLSSESIDLRNHLEKCKEKVKEITFMSKKFINMILQALKSIFVHRIVKEITEYSDGYFAVEMDASRDISGKEQCAIVLRYVDTNFNVFEKLLAITQIKDGTGKGIFTVLDQALKSVGLSSVKILAFSFDGASNMRSNIKGTASYIKKKNPLAISTWCFAHRVNLLVEDAINETFFLNEVLELIQQTAKYMS